MQPISRTTSKTRETRDRKDPFLYLGHLLGRCSDAKHYKKQTEQHATRVGRYFDILIYRDISNRDYRIEAKNLSDDLSKLSSCSMTIVILLRNMYIACRILNKLKVSLHSSNKYTLKKCISKTSIIANAFRSSCTACS